MFNFISLLGGERPLSRVHPSKVITNAQDDHNVMLPFSEKQPLRVHGLRMLELTERLSSVMKESEIETRDLVVDFSALRPTEQPLYVWGRQNRAGGLLRGYTSSICVGAVHRHDTASVE